LFALLTGFDYNAIIGISEMHIVNRRYKFLLYNKKNPDFLKLTDLKKMSINSELYKTFYYVAKFKSVSKASEELFITQPAVSRSIKILEEKLDCKLFIRTSKGVFLTTEGEILFTYVEMALNFFFLGEKKLKQVKGLHEGELSIGVGDSICRHYLLPFLKKFNSDNPGITIHITNQKSFEIVNMLKSGEIDLGLVNLPLEDPQLRLTQVMEIHDCFVVGEKYKFLSEKVISLTSLAKYPLMFIEKGSNSRIIVEKLFLDNKVRMTPSIELGNFELLTQFAEIDFGVACIIKEFFQKEFDEGRIFEVPLKENIPTRGIGVASLKMVPLSPAAKEFIYLLRN